MRKLFINMLEILSICIVLILLIPSVKALGTLQKNSYLEIKPGQIAEFEILFWGSENVEVELKEKSVPKDWVIIIEPRKFDLENITSSETVSLQGGYADALPVKITTIPPEDVKPGVYDMIINMMAGKTQEGISFFQEKNFNFIINITGQEETKQNSEEPVSPAFNIANFTAQIVETQKINLLKIIFWSLVVIIFLLIGWIVYRL